MSYAAKELAAYRRTTSSKATTRGLPLHLDHLRLSFAPIVLQPLSPSASVDMTIEGTNLAANDVLRFVPSSNEWPGCTDPALARPSSSSSSSSSGGSSGGSSSSNYYEYGANLTATLVVSSGLPRTAVWRVGAAGVASASIWRLCYLFGGVQSPASGTVVRRVGEGDDLLHVGQAALTFSPSAVATGVTALELAVTGIGLGSRDEVRLIPSSDRCAANSSNYLTASFSMLQNASAALFPGGARYNVTLGTLPGGTYRLCTSFNGSSDFSSQVGATTFGVGSSVSAFSPLNVFGTATATLSISGYGLTQYDAVTIVTAAAACHDDVAANATGTYAGDAAAELPERSTWSVAGVDQIPAGAYRVCIRFGGANGTAGTIQVGGDADLQLQLGSVASGFSPSSLKFGDQPQTLTIAGIGLSALDTVIVIAAGGDCATNTTMLLDAGVEADTASGGYPLASTWTVTPRSLSVGYYKLCVAFAAAPATFTQVGAAGDQLAIGPFAQTFSPTDIDAGAVATRLSLTGLVLAADDSLRMIPAGEGEGAAEGAGGGCSARAVNYRDATLTAVALAASAYPTTAQFDLTPNAAEPGLGVLIRQLVDFFLDFSCFFFISFQVGAHQFSCEFVSDFFDFCSR